MHDPVIIAFRRQYYQLVPAARFVFDYRDADEAETLQDAVVNVGLLTDADVPLAYRLSIVRTLMRQLDRQGFSVDERLVEWYAFAAAASPASKSGMEDESDQVDVRYHYTSSCDASITLRETPRVLTSHGTTGHRTWEAALALGDHLLSHDRMLKDARVLELGAGTGFLSVLCAKLGAAAVTATDGSDRMVELLKRNVEMNNVQDTVSCEQLWFGTQSDIEERQFDLILGADITYDEAVVGALVDTLARLLGSQPECSALIFATVRQEATYVCNTSRS